LAPLLDQGYAGIALALGALYAQSHVARGASVVWACVAMLLSLGSARAFPPLAVGLAAALAALAIAAVARGRIAAFLFCLLSVLPAAGPAAAHAGPIARMLAGLDARPAAPFTLAPIVFGHLSLVGLARVRACAPAVALILFSLGAALAGYRWPDIDGVLFGASILGFAMLACAALTRRADLPDSTAEAAALA
jgi:hypothetical protein